MVELKTTIMNLKQIKDSQFIHKNSINTDFLEEDLKGMWDEAIEFHDFEDIGIMVAPLSFLDYELLVDFSNPYIKDDLKADQDLRETFDYDEKFSISYDEWVDNFPNEGYGIITVFPGSSISVNLYPNFREVAKDFKIELVE